MQPPRISKKVFSGALSLVLLASLGFAQTTEPSSTSADKSTPQAESKQETPDQGAKPELPGKQSHPLEKHFVRNFFLDQKDIWGAPLHMKARDARWAIPFAGITTGLLMTDRTSSYQINRGSHFNTANSYSNYAAVAMGGGVAGMYLLGRWHGDERMRETGVLGIEAVLDQLPVTTAFKYAFARQRPDEPNYTGKFFSSGGGTSFFSEHSAIAWSLASVVAHEYPGPMTQFAAYGLASSISIARVVARQHAPTDVFVGAAVGYAIGSHVFHAHHNTDLDFGDFSKPEYAPKTNRIGSPYLQVGHWAYDAIGRLAAYGYVHSAFVGQRPWTRMVCAQMVQEADEAVADDPTGPTEARELVNELKTEFALELGEVGGYPVDSIMLESVYTRVLGIAGEPINDSQHFGQTIVNDFGRRYGEGIQNVTGFTSRAQTGRFSFYVNGEYQHSPSIPGLPLAARTVISNVDLNPIGTGFEVPSRDQFRLLDTYVSANYFGLDFSVGKQSLWWGPAQGAAMSISNNAEPFWMLRIDRADPFRIPFLSRFLGPFKYDSFFGKLADHVSPANPFMYGQKISFKPTQDLEFGFSRTTVFAGTGHVPLTFGSFWNSFSSLQNVTVDRKNSRDDPGFRNSEFDVSYRLPFLRTATLYVDSIIHDDVSPIAAPRHAGYRPGLYFAHLPGLPKLDLRIEGASTDPDFDRSTLGHYTYYENVYRDGYTNKQYLLGDWVGRQGKGYQAWSTYWLSPRSSIQVSYRRAQVSTKFLTGGTRQDDYAAKANLWFRHNLEAEAGFQYENWRIPLLAPTAKNDVTSYVKLTWWPKADLNAPRK